MADQVALG